MSEQQTLRAFRSSAGYYEALFDSQARLEREGPYLRQVLEQSPGRRVADLACGTGPHALFFAEQGATVTAFDLSPEMIAHASGRRPHAGIDYRVGDMRDVDGGPWDMAVCLGNSLCLIPVRDAVAGLFARLHGRLAPGGYFVTQTLNYSAPEMQEPVHRVVHKSVGKKEIVALKSLVPHGDCTLLSLSFYAFSGEAFETVSESAVLVHLTREDLEAYGERAGFRVVEAYGGFDRRPYVSETSGDLILRFQRM